MNLPPGIRISDIGGDDRLPPREAAALIGILHGARTFREVARAAGYASSHCGYRVVMRLKLRGLADWSRGKAGTIHATVESIPFR